MGLRTLPALNAALNATAAILLIRAYALIRAGQRDAHRKTMLAAFATSVLFLMCYLIYHAQVGSVAYQGRGAVRVVYFTILITHTVFAATVPVLAIVTLRRGLKGDFGRHRRVARWTFPVWLYVSVTGVVVYFMLYWL
jgi:uncharacterized membrane protein YozB (DUF420 family)